MRYCESYPHWALPSSPSFSMEQKSTGSITETCCWCRSSYQRSAALLQTVVAAHRGRDRVELLRSSSVLTCGQPINSPDLIPVDYYVWGMLQERVYTVSSTNPQYGRVAEASCCDMGWISAQRGGLWSWSVVKNTGSVYQYRRWSISTLAVMLLAWHSSFHTPQPVLFRVTNGWRMQHYPQSDEKVAFYKVVRWHFSGVVGKGVCFLLR